MPAKRTPKPEGFHVADSPFSALYETGRVPSIQETKMIQELLVEKKAHLAHLNSKVPKRRTGKKFPRQLRYTLEYTRRVIKFHQALIAPWRRLPVEIMSEIFLFTLEVSLLIYAIFSVLTRVDRLPEKEMMTSIGTMIAGGLYSSAKSVRHGGPLP
jgi:hypothetical protein